MVSEDFLPLHHPSILPRPVVANHCSFCSFEDPIQAKHLNNPGKGHGILLSSEAAFWYYNAAHFYFVTIHTILDQVPKQGLQKLCMKIK